MRLAICCTGSNSKNTTYIDGRARTQPPLHTHTQHSGSQDSTGYRTSSGRTTCHSARRRRTFGPGVPCGLFPSHQTTIAAPFCAYGALLPLAPPSPHPRELKKNTPSNLGIQSRPSDWTARTRLLLREGVCVRREGNRCEKTEAAIKKPIAAPAWKLYGTRPPLRYLCVLPAVRAAGGGFRRRRGALRAGRCTLGRLFGLTDAARPRTWRYVIAHGIRDKVHVTNSWQSSRACPVCMIVALCSMVEW